MPKKGDGGDYHPWNLQFAPENGETSLWDGLFSGGNCLVSRRVILRKNGLLFLGGGGGIAGGVPFHSHRKTRFSPPRDTARARSGLVPRFKRCLVLPTFNSPGQRYHPKWWALEKVTPRLEIWPFPLISGPPPCYCSRSDPLRTIFLQRHIYIR